MKINIQRYIQSKEDRIFFLLIGITYFIILLWAFLNNSTWDDDCAGRYFNTVNSLKDPSHFVSLWNRPLWVLLFALPSQLGKFTIPVIMGLLACISAWALYRSAQHLKLSEVYLVIPFLIFQPYFFGVGRDAMTEPLAVCILSLSLLFMLRKQWLWFAIMGSILPLARLELAVVLVFWLIPLLRHRQWKYIPVLALFTVLLNIAGALIIGEGDPLWLFHATVGGTNEENRYGHAPFNTYFARYFYVIGPVVFFFLISGFVDRILNRKVTLFLDGQFLVMFMLYTLFAWKLNVGNSAAFLRNLIPLSPLSAIIALYGFNYWMPLITKKKKAKFLFPLLAGIVSVLLTALFFRNRLKLHHLKTEEFDYYNLPVIGMVLLLMILFWRLGKKKKSLTRVTILTLVLTAITMAYIDFGTS